MQIWTIVERGGSQVAQSSIVSSQPWSNVSNWTCMAITNWHFRLLSLFNAKVKSVLPDCEWRCFDGPNTPKIKNRRKTIAEIYINGWIWLDNNDPRPHPFYKSMDRTLKKWLFHTFPTNSSHANHRSYIQWRYCRTGSNPATCTEHPSMVDTSLRQHTSPNLIQSTACSVFNEVPLAISDTECLHICSVILPRFHKV